MRMKVGIKINNVTLFEFFFENECSCGLRNLAIFYFLLCILSATFDKWTV